MTQPNKPNLNALISAYETDVQYPDVSGMEHLDMLVTRSVLAENTQRLTPAQQARLAMADQALLQQARLFYAAIQRIADLVAWRTQEQIPSAHWWWYLDVLAQLPEQPNGALSRHERVAA
ncbi:MAG: hypothetical protein U0350_34455 [Caldilineaceae bacterium]